MAAIQVIILTYTFKYLNRHLNFQYMDQQYTTSRLLQVHSHRSASDLIPKCRAEALKAKRAAARSKINIIACQLYQLKYDHQWEEEQLRRLVNKGESITQEFNEKIRKVQVQVEQLNSAPERIFEKLSFENLREKQESTLKSERSTEVGQLQKKETQKIVTVQLMDVTEIQNRKHIFETHKVNEKIMSPTKLKSSVKLPGSPIKKPVAKKFMSSIPIQNIIIFFILVFVVLALV